MAIDRPFHRLPEFFSVMHTHTLNHCPVHSTIFSGASIGFFATIERRRKGGGDERKLACQNDVKRSEKTERKTEKQCEDETGGNLLFCEEYKSCVQERGPKRS